MHRTPPFFPPLSFLAALCLLGAWGCNGETHVQNLEPGTSPQAKDIDPVTGKPVDPVTGKPVDPVTRKPVDPPVTQAPPDPTSRHLRRLTALQYRLTVEDALGTFFESKDFPQFNDDIPTVGMSNDPERLRVTDSNVDAFLASTQALALKSMASTPKVSACLAQTSEACFGELVEEVGLKLWRRPVEAQEKADLLELRRTIAQASGSRQDQVEFLLQALLASPQMLYRSELGVEEGEFWRLTPYELASALSYTLWNAPPDQTLLELARQDKLQSAEALLAQADRMSQDPRVAESLAEFFIDYLKFETILIKEKAEHLGLTSEVRAAMIEGVRMDLVEVFEQPGATLLDPFFLDSFYVNKLTAPFFGVNSDSETFEKVAMDSSQRLGLLSHPIFLSIHSSKGNSGIVKRGVFALEQLLCVHLGDPPPSIEPIARPEGFDPDKVTSRKALHVLHSSQAACVGCHRSIDPAGYGFENYDAAGRWRTVEKEEVQIDAGGTLPLAGEALEFKDSVGYIRALVGSRSMRRCLSNSFVTYVLGDGPKRAEGDAVFSQFNAKDGEVKAVLQSLIATPSFTLRAQKKETSHAK